MSGLGEELELLREGRASFAAFVQSTGADWRRIAESLYRRWWVPAGVEAADVEQELLVAAWQSTGAWVPERGMTLRAYVVWSAMAEAKKWINLQRNALRRDGKAHGRFPVALSSFPEGSEPREPEEGGVLTPEEVAEAREQTSFVLGEVSDDERAIFATVVASGGDLSRAVAMVFADPGLCLRARLGSEREAKKLTVRVVEGVLSEAASLGSG